MTKYEELIKKAALCHRAALNTTGIMRNIWLAHEEELKRKAGNLQIKNA